MPLNTTPTYNITQVNNVIGTRALNTPYTNNTGRTMFVFVSVWLKVAAFGDTSEAYAYSNAIQMASAYLGSEAAGVALQIQANIPLAVKPGDVYRVNSSLTGTGTIGLTSWVEAY